MFFLNSGREIPYPFFLKCCMYTSDKFWINMFEELAYGKAPCGTYISKDSICCRYKNKEFSYNFSKDIDPRKLYDDIYNLLTKKTGIFSISEKILHRINFDSLDDGTFPKNSWGLIRKKSIKEFIIINYIIDMKNKYSLSNEIVKSLKSFIFIGLMFHTIQSKDIEYVDGKILSIQNIEYEMGRIIYIKNIFNAQSNPDSSQTSSGNKKSFRDLWALYISGVKRMGCNQQNDDVASVGYI